MSSYLFTSESVSERHPDKVADQISDAVLDAILKEDKHAHVACETFIKTGVAIVGGEITTSAWVDLEELIRKVIVDIGYDSSEVGFDGHTCAVMNIIGKQSPDIKQGVSRERPEDQGAGDQGLMFGYATNETEVMMPAPIYYAHELVKRQSVVRRTTDAGREHLRPDAKSQVTFRYQDGRPDGIDAVVLSTQHNKASSQSDLRELVIASNANMGGPTTAAAMAAARRWRASSPTATPRRRSAASPATGPSDGGSRRRASVSTAPESTRPRLSTRTQATVTMAGWPKPRKAPSAGTSPSNTQASSEASRLGTRALAGRSP